MSDIFVSHSSADRERAAVLARALEGRGWSVLQAIVSPNGPGRIVVSTSVAVAGDSRTPGPQSHNVNLAFQAQPDGNWSFVRNCMARNDCN